MKSLKRTITVILLILYTTNVIKAETEQVQLKVGETSVLKIPSSVTTKTGFKVITSWRSINGSDNIDYSGYGSSVTVTVNSYTSNNIYLTCDYEYSSYGDKKETGQFEFKILISEPYFNFSASPRGGTVKKGKTVTFDCWIDNVYGFSNSQGDVKIYYTLNGATPSRNSTPYNAFYGITIEHTCTLKAIATWKGVESSVLTENYIVEDDLYLTASHSGGVVEKGTVVYLTANENGADIFYTLDGNTPSRSSTPYSSSGITINEDCTLKAIAYKNNMISDILSETYRLLVNPTEISVYLSSSTIKVGEMATANYSLKPSNASTTVTWTSEDPNIASVQSSTGKVVGVSEGTTNIIATTTNGLNAQCSITVSGEIYSYVNKDNFPDISFRRSILEQGIITEEDVRNAKILDVRGNGIESLKGIEYFTSLEEFYCTWNSVKTLDLSKNTKLRILECAHCGLTTLDLSQNKLLKLLDCSLNSIKGAGMDNLINSLPSVVNGVFRVKRGDNDNNICTTTQVAAAKAKLWKPYYYDGVKNGKEIWLEYEGVELNIVIDATNFPDENFRNFLLGKDYGKDGIITDIEIDNITTLKDIVLEDGLQSLKGIEFFTSLQNLYLAWQSIGSLDISNNTKLTSLTCIHCGLSSLDVSQNTALVSLNCSANGGLTSLKVSPNSSLKDLYCYGTGIKGSEMDKLINSLPLRSSNDGSFYAVYNQEWDKVRVTKNQVAAAKARGWTVYCEDGNNNWIEYEGSDLVEIAIDATNFPDENFRKKLLEHPLGKDGIFEGIEIKRISSLYLGNSYIESLKGIEYFTSLETLVCSGNQLTSLDVSQNTELKSLKCFSNFIKGDAMDKLINSLPLNTTNEKYEFEVIYGNDGNICTTSQVAAAKAKGWTPYIAWGEEYLGSDPSNVDRIQKRVNSKFPVFNLNGQRMNKPRKGINIIGGKKVFVK